MYAVFFTFASNRLLATISLSFVGQLGPTELAAAGLATSLANVTGDSILTGIANALQTLCGQVCCWCAERILPRLHVAEFKNESGCLKIKGFMTAAASATVIQQIRRLVPLESWIHDHFA